MSTTATNFWTDDIWNDQHDPSTTDFLAWFYDVSGVTFAQRDTLRNVRCVAAPSTA
jgi:hypothetical protein